MSKFEVGVAYWCTVGRSVADNAVFPCGALVGASGQDCQLRVAGVGSSRRMALAVLTRRFGELPAVLGERIAASDAAWCQSLVERAITASSLSELTDML